MGLLDDLDEYAKLLTSIGTHRKNRPLLPLGVAQRIKILRSECESLEEVSKRLSLDSKVIGQFLSLLNLPETVHGIIGWGGTDKFRLAFTSATIISALEDSKDQEILAKAAQIHGFKKHEIQDVVALKTRNPDKSIEECIESVFKFRPVVEKGYMVITNLNDNTLQRLDQLNLKQPQNIETVIFESMNRVLPKNSINGVKIKGSFVVLNLTEEGYRAFENLDLRLDTTSHHVTDVCVNKFLDGKKT